MIRVEFETEVAGYRCQFEAEAAPYMEDGEWTVPWDAYTVALLDVKDPTGEFNVAITLDILGAILAAEDRINQEAHDALSDHASEVEAA